MGIKENLNKIKEQIGSNEVKIIAVTKYANQELISEALKLGIFDFGESYIQDALEKTSQWFPEETTKKLINWHFIGRLQKNKVKTAVGRFCLIHSVDSIELAELINKIANQRGLRQDILLQVNITQDASKTGFSIDELKSNFDKLLNFQTIKIKGLMTIAPHTEDKEITRDCFLNLHYLKNHINDNHDAQLKELSMGMSNDYMEAIDCGATMVRIGRAIFKDL